MQSLTPANVKQLRADLAVALATVTARHGVAFNIGTMRFDPTAVRFKVEGALAKQEIIAGTVTGFTPVPVDPYAVGKQNFLRYVGIHGFKSTDLGRKFRIGTGEFELVGYSPSKPKYPMQILNVKSKRMFKASKSQVQLGLAVSR